jgi:hypothetical protein
MSILYQELILQAVGHTSGQVERNFSCALSWRIIVPHSWSANPILDWHCSRKPWAFLPQAVCAGTSETQQTWQITLHGKTLASNTSGVAGRESQERLGVG